MFTLNHIQGDTFSWAGFLTLPAAETWTAECALRIAGKAQTPGIPDVWIPSTLTLIGPNADIAYSDYCLLLYCDGETTMTWASITDPTYPVRLFGAIKLMDNSIPPVELTTDWFQIALYYDLVPLR